MGFQCSWVSEQHSILFSVLACHMDKVNFDKGRALTVEATIVSRY
jgi:hypothetical protein